MATGDFERVLSGQVPNTGSEINKILGRGDSLVRLNEDGAYEGGESPLFIAIKYSASDSVLNAIIKNYPDDINKPTSYETGNNMTPLQFASSIGNERIENLLKEKGAVSLVGGRRRRKRKTGKKRKTCRRRKTCKRRIPRF